MIFGFGKKKAEVEEPEEEEEVEQVLFQGALNGQDANLAANQKLARAGLVPIKELFSEALRRRAHTIRIEPKGERGAVATLMIDGVAYPPHLGSRYSKQQATAITQMAKLLAGLDIKQRKTAQSGGIKAEFQETPYKLFVESAPAKGGGERLTVRVEDMTNILQTPEDVGFTDELKWKIREMASHQQGMVLVCGPPRSGTTTTTFALLRSIDAYLYDIFSIADPGDRELVNIREFDFNPDDDLKTTLRRCIRSEAQVIFVDPIRDAETAGILFEMQEDVTIISEFTAKNVAEGIVKLMEWTGDAGPVASGLRGLFSQKLIRRLCQQCKEPYRPNAKVLKKVGLPPETKTLYRPPKPPEPDQPGAEEYEPCRKCNGIGYFGRVALIEYIEMSEAMRQLVAGNPSAADIKAQARQEKMQTFQQDGLRLVAAGTTSLEELQRSFKAGG